MKYTLSTQERGDCQRSRFLRKQKQLNGDERKKQQLTAFNGNHRETEVCRPYGK